MSTEKLSTTSFTNHVGRSWLTRFAIAGHPSDLPEVLDLEDVRLPLRIGRDEGPRDGYFLLGDDAVSATHAELRKRDGIFELVDLGSSNGTLVNGTPLTPHAPHHLKDGDVLQLGGAFLRFRTGVFKKSTIPKTPTENDLLTSVCPEFIDEVHELRGAALMDTPVLIVGETGTGKEIFARKLHEMSRRSGKYVAVNTAGLQAGLIPAELYGVARGAHSTAQSGRDGLVRTADKGTVLLDEIGDMPMEVQPTLLRIIQEGSVLPVGADKYIPVDVRWIAATHQDPEDPNVLRPDLCARLSGCQIELPALRDRIEDIGLLIARMLNKAGAADVKFAPDAYARMVYYDWPMNVRQLNHFIDRIAEYGEEVSVDLLERIGIGFTRPTREENEICDWDPEYIKTILREFRGNTSAAARSIGVNRMKLHRYLKRYGIDANAYRLKARDRVPGRSPYRKPKAS